MDGALVGRTDQDGDMDGRIRWDCRRESEAGSRDRRTTMAGGQLRIEFGSGRYASFDTTDGRERIPKSERGY